MKYLIEVCDFSKEVDSMFDLLSSWKKLQQVGTLPEFIYTYELNSSYEWVELDAQRIWDGMSMLFGTKKNNYEEVYDVVN